MAEAGARLTLTGGNSAGLAELVDAAGIGDAAVVTRRPETPADAAAMVEAAVARHGRLRTRGEAEQNGRQEEKEPTIRCKTGVVQ